jgi:exosortase
MQIVLKRLPDRNVAFILFAILSLILFWSSLGTLVKLTLQDDRYSHILPIPLIAASLVFLERKKIFASRRYCPSLGLPLLCIGLVLFGLAQSGFSSLNQNDRLSLVVLSMVLVWIAGFVLCYGTRSFRAGLFEWLFLLLMIPIPTVVLDKAVLALQEGSAITTYALFKVLGVPILWQHFRFSLPGVEIEIAKECSGIRSSLALFIASILAGHMFLQSNWTKSLFSLLSVPIIVFKNAVRIVTISWLGVYVDSGFLHGRLHRYGGLPFSIISLAMMLAALFALQKRENQMRRSDQGESGASKGKANDPAPLAVHSETA